MKNEIMQYNFKKSLEQKYNAVCFDIDGTLTESRSIKIDERAIRMIAQLLKRKIPVVFITGRGETGLNDLRTDIYDKIIREYKLDFNDLKRMYALTNDGARLFFSTSNNDNLIFNNNVYISSDDELNQLKEFNNKVMNALKEKSLNHFCKVTYSKDIKDERLLNIRIVFESNNDKVITDIMDVIDDIIKSNDLKSLVITRGIYKDNTVIQIGTAKKEIAIERAEKIIGVPKNSMMRIGDCGDLKGNDYSMLNCEQGYSVDRISEELNACFPVFDEDGNVLKGVEATLFLIKKAKLLPTVCLESADKKDYFYNYAKIENEILSGRNKYLQQYNNIVNQKFGTFTGINDLFDSESGSIKIPMHEWIIIDHENPLFKLWNISNNGKLMYSLRDNHNYLLRGSKTYYYLLANRKSENKEDYTSFEDVIEWYKNNLDFLHFATNALNDSYKFDDVISQKLTLGVLDNIRNILLVLINHNINSQFFTDNILINLNSKENSYINNLFEGLYFNDYLMAKMCFTNESITNEQISLLINSAFELLKTDYSKFREKAIDKDYSKEFRAYREIDNFAENFIAIKLNSVKNVSEISTGVVGMCYGGLELPIIYKVINPQIDDVLLLKFNKAASGYANKQLVDLRKFNINNYGGLQQVGEIKSDKVILLDDNILTGKTIQLAINSLYDEKIHVQNVNIVRYPSVNRVDQMFMENHGAVDYKLFFDYITGLCFPSPYSWRDENNLDPYLDSLGVFDLNRKKIVECLIKNHDYKEHSEVHEYKRRLIK